MTVSDEQLAAWEALASAATPGPWEMSPEGDLDDNAFVCASRTAVPELIAALRAARADIDRLHDVVRELQARCETSLARKWETE